MKDLVESIVRSIVRWPEAVRVTEVQTESLSIFQVEVDPSDLGRIIGREGKTASAIRVLLAAAGVRINRRAMLEIDIKGAKRGDRRRAREAI